jgi:tetratricopeptide (TPR) repeat protein
MQLLIQRDQGKSMILRRPIFRLWTKFELTTEESALITKYHVGNHILVEGYPGEFKWAMITAGVVAFFVFSLTATGRGLVVGTQLAIFFFVISAFGIYHTIREEVRVADVLEGSFFDCKSVVSLMTKEQEIAKMANAFRHLLEAMKNWGGREIIELEPYKEPVLRMIEPPHAAEAISGEAGLVTEAVPERARKGLMTPIWLSVFGAIIAVMAGIGGYLYLARPVGETPEVAQEPISIERSPPSTESSVSQETSDVQQPDTWKESLQEGDITQVLSLAEEKLMDVKRRAEESLPPKRGNRKTARAANDRGLAYLQSGRISEAIGAFQEAHQANPADIEIVNNLGYAYLLNNDPDSAEAYVLIALTMQPERSAAWGNLGQIYVKKGQIPAAVASFSNAYRFSRDLNQTHSYFLGWMEKENDVNLRQALWQATQIGQRKFLSAEANLDMKSKN